MKNLLYLFVFICLFSCKENAHKNENKSSEEDSHQTVASGEDSPEKISRIDNIEDIQKEHAYITKKVEKRELDSISFSYNCRDEKKGEVIYFSEQGQLRFIRHNYNEYSHFSATDEYYIKDGSLFFVFYDHLAWNFENDSQTRDNTTEKRFYIIDDKPVKCFQKEFTVLSNENNSVRSEEVPNSEIECPSLRPILEKFRLLFDLSNQNEDISCLEDN